MRYGAHCDYGLRRRLYIHIRAGYGCIQADNESMYMMLELIDVPFRNHEHAFDFIKLSFIYVLT
jgi:hypothetical protein